VSKSKVLAETSKFRAVKQEWVNIISVERCSKDAMGVTCWKEVGDLRSAGEGTDALSRALYELLLGDK
jgi:hypothetical protein